PTDKLRASFDAVVLAGCATAARELTVEGRNLTGVHFAMEFLQKSCKSLLDSNFADGQYINAKGKNVIVIGGGDTGTDCVASSLRHGCKSLVQFEIADKPPDKILTHDAWLGRARTFQTDYGQEEAIAAFGSDPRQYNILTKRFVGDENGNLIGVETVHAEWTGENCRELRECEGTQKFW